MVTSMPEKKRKHLPRIKQEAREGNVSEAEL